MLPSPQLREVSVKDYLIVLKRRIWIILGCFVIVVSRITYQSYKKIPLYQAFAKVLIENVSPYIAPVQKVYNTPQWMDKDYIQSQLNILTSKMLAKKAVEALVASGDKRFAEMKAPEEAFQSGVSVSLIPGTQLIRVGYIHTDPVLCAKYANALANAFVQQDLDKRMEVNRFASRRLEEQVNELRAKLEQSEGALNDFLRENKILSSPDAESRAQGVLQDLKQERVALLNEQSELSKRYKAKHPKMIAVVSRIEAVDRSIVEENKKLFEFQEKVIKFDALKREMESDKSLYESFLRRTKETEVSKELETTNIRIIDLASVPGAPFTPNRKKDVQTGILLGLLFGVGLAFILEYMDSTVKTAEDIETYVKLPFLGYVPSAKTEVKVSRDNKDIDLGCSKFPSSRFAESYRSIRTSIIFSAPEDRPLKTILITSTSPREGKTTVSINLSTVFANANERIVLVEADMRRPRVAHSLGLEANRPGLSSFLAGAASLDQVVTPTSIPNFFVIPSGPKPPNPAELLTSGKTRVMLSELKAKYDRIIVDSPPVLTVADTAILANIVDGVIHVIMASFLNIDAILRGRQRLYEAKARIIGVILNNVNVKREDSYYYYHYYYGESKK